MMIDLYCQLQKDSTGSFSDRKAVSALEVALCERFWDLCAVTVEETECRSIHRLVALAETLVFNIKFHTT